MHRTVFCAIALCIIVTATSAGFASRAFAADAWETIIPPETSGYAFNTMRAIGGTLYLGTDHGLYVSTDNGTSWSTVSTGLSNQNVLSIALGWSFDGESAYQISSSDPIIVGTEAGIYAKTFGGAEWVATATGPLGAVYDIEFDQSEAVAGVPVHAYAATDDGVYRSDDSGANWTLQDTDMEGLGVRRVVTDFTNGLVYALTLENDLYSAELSSISGVDESWTLVRDDGGYAINDVSMINALGGLNWLATSGDGILKSDESGGSWTAADTGLGGGAVHMVESDYFESNIAYAATDDGVYRTTNEALEIPQWLSIQRSLADTNIHEVRANPANSLRVYALGDGVYRMSLSDAYADLTDPSAITDLEATVLTDGYISLTWTAPGEDGIYGTTTSYIMRYSTEAITEGNWASATAISEGVPTPEVYGTEESYTFTVPESGLTYYFAIKAVDEAGNESALSNTPSVDIDVTAPTLSGASPTGALSSGTSDTVISISTNEAAICRYSPSQGGDYSSMTAFSSTGGTSHSTTVTGLSSGTSYSYYVKCKDSAGNTSSEGAISFFVATQPSRSRGGGGGGGTSILGQTASAAISLEGGFSIRDLVELLIAIDAIAPDKVVAARAFALSSGGGVTLPPSTGQITRDLYFGISHSEVRTLQQILGKKGYQVTAPGFETTYFGPVTLSAVQRFQCATMGVCQGSTGYGRVGPATRAKLLSAN